MINTNGVLGMKMIKNNSFLSSRLVTVFVLISALLSACKAMGKSVMTVPAGAKAGDLILESCTYEADKTEYVADCGILVVPENWGDHNSLLIALPVTRVHALSENPGCDFGLVADWFVLPDPLHPSSNSAS
jgi:hypothetical protein